MIAAERTRFGVIAGLLALAFFMPGLHAEIYKYRENGVTYYTDQPPDRDYAVRMVMSRKGWVDPTKIPAFTPAKMRYNRQRFRDHVASAADRYGLPLPLLHAVITAESAWNPDAVSTAGAAGLMQLMPATAARYDVGNRFAPAENIRGGSAYLRDLMALFDGDLDLVLAAYNAGEGAVRKYGNRIPPYRETERYVSKVHQYHRRYAREMDSDGNRVAETGTE